MLSDRHRPAKIALLLVAMVALCSWYSWQSSRQPIGSDLCRDDPAAHDGRVIDLSLWRVHALGSSSYDLAKVDRVVTVVGDGAGLETGDTVSVQGRCDASSGNIVEHYREVHHHRRYKAALGALGLLLFCLYVPLRFRWRDGRLVSLG